MVWVGTDLKDDLIPPPCVSVTHIVPHYFKEQDYKKSVIVTAILSLDSTKPPKSTALYPDIFCS